MNKWREPVLIVLFAVIYVIAAFAWEKAIARIVVWWVAELIALRPSLSSAGAAGYLIVALFFGLVVIPSFLWFPVTLFKELRYLLNQPDSKAQLQRAACWTYRRISYGIRPYDWWLFHYRRPTGRG